MNFFNKSVQLKLARSLLTKRTPIYVQYYITARCNQYCEQCNIIYAQADAPEMNIHQIRKMAENLKKIGVCIVLLIGGEPFARKDLPDIVRAFIENDIHVRMQTNGLASKRAMVECIEAGGHDISISLDSLNPQTQNRINRIPNSIERTMKAVANVNEFFPDNGKGFFGSVLMPRSLRHIENVVEFATRIGWWVSLVPCHTTSKAHPLGFRTFDDDEICTFSSDAEQPLLKIIERLKKIKRNGKHLYDCDEYLDDIGRFLSGEPIQWRRRNHGVCDSPNLYFAIEPNGLMQPCCDYKLNKEFPIYAPDFFQRYQSGEIHEAIYPITSNCSGCMYGSYPEITLTARFIKPMLHRFSLFTNKFEKLKRYSVAELIQIAKEVEHSNPTNSLK